MEEHVIYEFMTMIYDDDYDKGKRWLLRVQTWRLGIWHSVSNTAHWKFMSSWNLLGKVDIDLPDDTTSYTTWIESASTTLRERQVSLRSLLADFPIF